MKRGSTHSRAPRTRMNRRKLLQGSVAIGGAAGALASPGCAHGPYLDADELPLPDPAVVEGIVASIDRRLAWIDQQSLPPSLIPRPGRSPSPEQQEQAARWTTLFRQSVRTLYVTGRFLDLPDEIKIHPDVQERVLAAQPEMNEAVFGVTELLESLRPEDHRGIRATLRARPDLGEQLAALLDEPAREDGIPFKRRMSVRSIALGLTRADGGPVARPDHRPLRPPGAQARGPAPHGRGPRAPDDRPHGRAKIPGARAAPGRPVVAVATPARPERRARCPPAHRTAAARPRWPAPAALARQTHLERGRQDHGLRRGIGAAWAWSSPA